MTTLYSLNWEEPVEDGGRKHHRSQVFFTSETLARKKGPIFAQQHGTTVTLEKWQISDKRDLAWLCSLMSTHHPETGELLTNGAADADPVELTRWEAG
jgi:hypothetical protein